MTQLDWNHKRLIVKLLATGADPGEIVDTIFDASLIRLQPDDVLSFDPHATGEGLSPDLRDLYEQTRRQYGIDETRETIFEPVASVEDLSADGAIEVDVDGHNIALFRQGDAYFALDNTCTHRGGPLCEGELDDGEVECPWHGARFNLATGEATQAPAPDGVSTYEVRVQDDELLLGIERGGEETA